MHSAFFIPTTFLIKKRVVVRTACGQIRSVGNDSPFYGSRGAKSHIALQKRYFIVSYLQNALVIREKRLYLQGAAMPVVLLS